MEIYLVESNESKAKTLKTALEKYENSITLIVFHGTGGTGDDIKPFRSLDDLAALLPSWSSSGEYIMLGNAHLLEHLLRHDENGMLSMLRAFGNPDGKSLLYFYGDHSSRIDSKLIGKLVDAHISRNHLGYYSDPLSLFDLKNKASDIVEDLLFRFYMDRLTAMHKLGIGSCIAARNNPKNIGSSKIINDVAVRSFVNKFIEDHGDRKAGNKSGSLCDYLQYLPIEIDSSVASEDIITKIFPSRLESTEEINDKSRRAMVEARKYPPSKQDKQHPEEWEFPRRYTRYIVIGTKPTGEAAYCYFVEDSHAPRQVL